MNMNTEETKILNPQPSSNGEERDAKKEKRTSASSKIGYAAGGFAAGAMSGAAVSAYAAGDETPVAEEPAPQEMQPNEVMDASTQENVQTTPQPEEVLLATDEGIRVAQVNDDASFGEAFADARAQVGPGGVFEWRGHVYSTYYEKEWNSMSAEERAQYQSKIDYNEIGGPENNPDEQVQAETATSVSDEQETVMASNAEMTDSGQGTTEVKVLGVEAVTDAQGNPITVAGIEVNGEQALLVDVDNDSTMDVLLADANGDGRISENEIYDFSDANVSVEDLQQHLAMQQDPHGLLACNDGMPDYVNDADVSSLA